MRRALFSIMLIGIVAVGATIGGLAAFHDTESSEGNTFQAGDLDLKIDWETSYNGSVIETVSWNDLDASGDGPIFNFTDVKPGDYGETTISVHVFTNDAWVCGEIVPYSYDDVSTNEPESLVDNEDFEADNWDGELAQNLDIAIWLENDGNNYYNEETDWQLFSGKFSELDIPFYFNMDQNLDPGDGTQPLIGCENYYIGVSWSIDSDVGNEIQSDEIMFDIIFDAYQYRHQEDNNPCISCEDIETLYLSNGSSNDQDGLYSVDLVGDNANLTELYSFDTETYFDSVTHIGATPDGSKIYVVGEVSGHLGEYSMSDGTFSDLGYITGYPGSVVQVAVSPEGQLYITSASNDTLYTVDVSGPSATAVGDTGIDIRGADIAFDAYGTLYLYSSGSKKLYTVDTITGATTEVGSTGVFLTGLAIRAGGTGDLVGSANESDEIITIDKSDGSIVNTYSMKLDGEDFDHIYGDMTVGAICVSPE